MRTLGVLLAGVAGAAAIAALLVTWRAHAETVAVMAASQRMCAGRRARLPSPSHSPARGGGITARRARRAAASLLFSQARTRGRSGGSASDQS